MLSRSCCLWFPRRDPTALYTGTLLHVDSYGVGVTHRLGWQAHIQMHVVSSRISLFSVLAVSVFAQRSGIFVGVRGVCVLWDGCVGVSVRVSCDLRARRGADHDWIGGDAGIQKLINIT